MRLDQLESQERAPGKSDLSTLYTSVYLTKDPVLVSERAVSMEAPDPRQLCFENSGHVAHRTGATEASRMQFMATQRSMLHPAE